MSKSLKYPFRIPRSLYLRIKSFIKFRHAIFITLLFLQMGFVQAQFGPRVNINRPVSYSPGAVSSDLDNDGDMDIIAATDNRAVWYQNDGTNNFWGKEKTINVEPGEKVNSITTADFDKDGDLDVAIGMRYGWAWFGNDGYGNFIQKQTRSVGYFEVGSIHASDLDADGNIDIVVGIYNWEETVGWYRNNGNGSFDTLHTISTNIAGGVFVTTADLDNDSDLDVISASGGDDKLSWYANDGSGNFGVQKSIGTSDQVYSCYTGDIDGDNFIDIVTCSVVEDDIFWFKNDGAGNFSNKKYIYQTLANYYNPYNAMLYDVDKDGIPDVITQLSSEVVWFKNDGTGNFSNSLNFGLWIGYLQSLHIGDFDKDNDLDLVTTSFGSFVNEVLLFDNDGLNNFRTETLGSIQSNVSAVFSADLDNDGDNDIISASSADNKIAWFENNGIGIFKAEKIIHTGSDFSSPEDVFVMDVNGDGNPDIIACSYYHSDIFWFENKGNGTFASGKDMGITNWAASSIFVKDLNNDGKPDIILGNKNYGHIAWSENLGGGSFSFRKIINDQDGKVYSVFSMDLNNDGNNDIVTANWNTDKIVRYQNDGNGNFSVRTIIDSNLVKPMSILLIDVDKDGDLDIAAASQSDTISWYENDGTGNFTNKHIISSTANSARAVASFDADGDGDMDLIGTIAGNDKIILYLNDGSNIFTTQILIDDLDSNPVDIYAIDIDNDGDIDLVVGYGDNVAVYENYLYSVNTISGKVFFDMNTNGIFDSIDYGAPKIQLSLFPAAEYKYTLSDGVFKLTVNPGSYNLNYYFPDSNLWVLTTDSSEYNISITELNRSRGNLNFGFAPETLLTSVSVSLTSQPTRCNVNNQFWINYTNTGTTIPSGIIILETDTLTDFISAYPVPDSIRFNKIYWSYDSLLFFTENRINLILQMPGVNSTGDTLKAIITVNEKDPGGNILYTAKDTLSQILRCSFDPNDKIVDPVGYYSPGFIRKENDKLVYTIRFQNTGNDTAFLVVIKDTLSTLLDWKSLWPLSSSHPVLIHVDSSGIAEFRFDNILLPDSNTNTSASNGFVKYNINLNPNLSGGEKITNSAAIFFDGNPAIYTNTVLNTILDCTELLEFSTNKLDYCIGDSLIAVNSNQYIDSYKWTFNDSIISSDSMVNILLNSMGTFYLDHSIKNLLCMINSTLDIKVKDCNTTYMSETSPFSDLEHINVYPNPINSTLNIKISIKQSETIVFRMFNVYSEEIMKFTENCFNQIWRKEINMEDYKSGIYFVEIRSGTEEYRTKVLHINP